MNEIIKNNLIETYNKYAEERNKKNTYDFKLQEINNFTKILKLEKKHTILEIGCGTGQESAIIENTGFNLLAIDISPAMIEFTRKKGIQAKVLDCYHLNSLQQKFDSVFSLNCLLHIPKNDIKTIFKNIHSILNTNGLFYLGLWGGDDFSGIYKNDSYEPKRFFVFYRQMTLFNLLTDFFEIEYYKRIIPRQDSIFHSLILRKKN